MSSLDLSLVLSSASEQNTASVTVQIFFFWADGRGRNPSAFETTPSARDCSLVKHNIEQQKNRSPISSSCHQVNGCQDTGVPRIPAGLLRGQDLRTPDGYLLAVTLV